LAIELKVQSDSRQARKDLSLLNRSVENIDRTTRDSVQGLKKLAIGAAAAFAAISAGSAITNVTDSYRRLEARIALTNKGLQEQQHAFIQINKIALETRSNQESLADLYSRIGRATKVLGVEQKTVIKITRSIAQAITISGSSAESANSAIVQLGQGLAAGALRGQELNSVMEQTPAVAQAIARGMGITIGQLRAFANEGKLSAQAVVDALDSQTDHLNEEFSRIPVTFAQALLVLTTGLGRIVNEVDQVFGLTVSLNDALLRFGKKMNAAAVPIGNFLRSLQGTNYIMEEVINSVKAMGSVIVSVAKFAGAAFDRMIPLSLLLRLEQLKNFIFVELLRGTGELVRLFITLDTRLTLIAAKIDVATARFERSFLSKGFRAGAVGMIRIIGDIQAAFALAEAAIIIFGARISRGVLKFGIELGRLIGIVKNSLLRIGDEFADFENQFNFGMVFRRSVEEAKRLKFLVGTVADVTKRVTQSFKDAYIAIIGNSWWTDTVEEVVEKSYEFYDALTPINDFLDKVQNGFKNTWRKVHKETREGVENVYKSVGGLVGILGGLALFKGVSILAAINPVLGAVAGVASLLAVAIKGGFIQLKTFKGVMQDISDKVDVLTRKFDILGMVTQGVSFSKGLLEPLLGILTVVRELARPLATAFGNIFGSALSAAALLGVATLKFGFVGVLVGLGTIFSNELMTGVNGVLDTFGTNTAKVMGNIADDAGRVAEALTGALLRQVPQLINIMYEIGRGFLRGFVDSVPVIGGLLTGLFDIINSLTLGLLSTFTGGALMFLFFGGKFATLGIAIANTFRAVKTLATGTFASEFGGLSQLFFGTAGESGLLLKIRAFMGSALASVGPAMDTFRSFVLTIAAQLQAAVASVNASALLSSISGYFQRFIFGLGGVLGAIREAVIGAFTVTRAASSAADAASSSSSLFRRGGIMRKLLFGAIGIAGILGAMGAFASDAEGTMSGMGSGLAFAEMGLLAVSLFGVAGIGIAVKRMLAGLATVSGAVGTAFTAMTAMARTFALATMPFVTTAVSASMATIATVTAYTMAAVAGSILVATGAILAGLTAILIHPVFLAIAAIVASLMVVGGIFGAIFFGEGDGFFAKLDNFGIRLATHFDMIDTFVDRYDRKSVMDRIIGDFDPSVLDPFDNRDITPSGPQDIIDNNNLNLEVMTGGEFQDLIESSLNMQDAIIDLGKVQVDALSSQQELINAEEKLLTATENTNEILEKVAVRLQDGGREIIDKGTEGTALEAGGRNFTTAVLDTVATLWDWSVGQDKARLAVQAREDRLQQEDGRLTADVAANVSKQLSRIKDLEKTLGVSIGSAFTQQIKEAEVELTNLSNNSLLFGDSDEAIRALAQKASDKLETALSDGLNNVKLFGFAKNASSTLKEIGVNFSEEDLMFVGPKGRKEINDLIAKYELAATRFSNSTTKNVAANVAAMRQAQRDLALSVGSQESRLGTMLKGSGSRGVDSGVFSNLDSSELETIRTNYNEISKAKEKIVALNGNDLVKEKELLALIESRRRSTDNIISANSMLNDLISETGLSQRNINNLTDEQLKTRIDETIKVQELKAELESLGPINSNNLKRFREITLEIANAELAQAKLLVKTADLAGQLEHMNATGFNIDITTFLKQTDFVQRRLKKYGEDGAIAAAELNAAIAAGDNDSIKLAADKLDTLGQAGERFVDSMRRGEELARGVQNVFQSSVKDMLMGGSLEDVMKSAALKIGETFLDSMLEQISDNMFSEGGLFGDVSGKLGGMFASGSEGEGDLGGVMNIGSSFGEADPGALAAEGLTDLAASTEIADGGILSWLSSVGQSIASALGFGTASKSAAVSAAGQSKAQLTVTGTIGKLTLSFAAADIAAAALAKSLTAAAIAGGAGVAAATGGLITGPGTATSDSIPAMLSNGEYVINAKQTKQHLALIRAINSGQDISKFSTGGPVGDALPILSLDKQSQAMAMSSSSHNSGSTTINLQVTGNVDAATRKAVREMGSELATQVENNFKERGVLNG
jgi:tape measure domain-containing protein